MLYRYVVGLIFILLSSTSIFAQKYSVFTFPFYPPCDAITGSPYDENSDTCTQHVDSILDAAATAGFNTIAINYMASVGPGPGSVGSMLDTNTTWRNEYRNLIYKILNNYSFYLMIRINCDAISLAKADPHHPIPWADTNSNMFLKHLPIDEPSHRYVDPTAVAWRSNNSGHTTWNNTIDFHLPAIPDTVQRQRMLDPSNATVDSVIHRVWRGVIHDVQAIANDMNVQNRIICFTLNMSPYTESDYWYAFFVGNDPSTHAYNSDFDLYNSNSARINWIHEWEEQHGAFHGELSNLVLAEKNFENDSLGFSAYTYTFGAQWSGAQSADNIMRGNLDLALIAKYLNPGDWIHVADIADSVYHEFNHNFSMDYIRSIASTYGLNFSNECSWPTFLFDSIGPNGANAAYRQQAFRSFSHGARAFVVSNWADTKDSRDALSGYPFHTSPDPDTYFIPYVTQNYVDYDYSSNSNARGQQAIFFDPWAIYANQWVNYDSAVTRYFVPALYSSGVLKEDYDLVSNNGSARADIITPELLSSDPSILNNYQRIYVPAINTVISDAAKAALLSPLNKRKLSLGNTNVGGLDMYQNGSSTISTFLASDLLWVDKNNKYSSCDGPGLRVTLSDPDGSAFAEAALWASWGGLYGSYGFYVGDFDGDGNSDFLNLKSSYDLEVVLSNGSNSFTPLQNWGSWGVDASDMLVGDFNGDGLSDLLWVDQYNKYSSYDGPGLRVSLSTGYAFSGASLWTSREDLAGSSGNGFYVGDFNGDGYSDFLNFKSDTLWVVFSNGSGFSSKQDWGTWGADASDLLVGDFNGDGKSDLLWVDKNDKFPSDVSPDLPGLQVSLSNGSGFDVATLWDGWGGLSGSGGNGFYVGDFNGDGYSDFMTLSGSDLYVVISNGVNALSSMQNWGSWGADASDLLVGNFGGTGTLAKKAITRPTIVPDFSMVDAGNFLLIRGISGVANIYSISGKRLVSATIEKSGSLDISRLGKGTYFLTVGNKKRTFVKLNY